MAFGPHGNGLGDLDHAVREHADIAVEMQDTFVGRHARRHEKQEQGEQALHSTVPNFARGTLAASSEDFWKNSRASKPNRPATILLGTLSVIVL